MSFLDKHRCGEEEVVVTGFVLANLAAEVFAVFAVLSQSLQVRAHCTANVLQRFIDNNASH